MKSKETPTKCSHCGSNTGPFTLFASPSTGESHQMCAHCMSRQSAEAFTDIEELDNQIEMLDKMLGDFSEMMKTAKMPEVPEELRKYTFSPTDVFQMMQMTVGMMKAKRMELAGAGPVPERLQYELDKCIAEENYEQAALIQQQLNQLKNDPTAFKDQQPSLPKAVEKEPVGKCVVCRQRYPKPPGLFHQFDIGECHNMCLSCCVFKLPKYATSVEMAEQMIEATERFIANTQKIVQLDPPNSEAPNTTVAEKLAKRISTELNAKKMILIMNGTDEKKLEKYHELLDLLHAFSLLKD